VLLSTERTGLHSRVGCQHNLRLGRKLTKSRCHQQMWDCFPTTAIDNMFLGTTGLYHSWSTVCEEVFTFSPTTMMVTKPPAYDQELCLALAIDCESLTVSMTSCNSAFSTGAAELDDCLCNDDMLYYGSRCDIDFNERCLRRTWDPTAIYSNKVCGATAQTGPTSRSPLPSSSTASQLEPTSSYVPPAPSSTVGTGAVATAPATGNGMARRAPDIRSSGIAFAFVVGVFVV
jgi:hypothetical protein